MNATDFNALPILAETLSTIGWVIYKYEVLGPENAEMTIIRKEPESKKEETEF